jgi:uncharacterized protein YhbP (UPF0306 family)
MFFLFDEETNEIFVLSHSGSKKIKNIETNPKVCLTVDVRDPENPFENRGVMVQGTAVVEKPVDPFSVSQDTKLMRIYKGFNQKYPVLSEAQSLSQVSYQEFTEVLVRIRANKMVYWKGPRFVSVNFNVNKRQQ